MELPTNKLLWVITQADNYIVLYTQMPNAKFPIANVQLPKEHNPFRVNCMLKDLLTTEKKYSRPQSAQVDFSMLSRESKTDI